MSAQNFQIYSDKNIPVQYTNWLKRISESSYLGFCHGIWNEERGIMGIFKDVEEHKDCDFMMGYREGVSFIRNANVAGGICLTKEGPWNDELLKELWRRRRKCLREMEEELKASNS